MKKKTRKGKRSLFHKIVNFFIAIAAAIIVLIVLFLGISQTSTFREYLREKIVDTVNSSINGKLYIGEIDGTLLTTISLKDISLSDSSNSTIFYSERIEVKINPFQLIERKILLREIVIHDAEFSLLQKENGKWNIATLSKSVAEPEKEVTEEGFDFPFIIQINELNLNNLRFVVQTYENVGNNNIYRYINFNDLIIDKFNLSVKAIADISNNNYSINLKKFSFSPNVERFKLQQLSGIFVYQNKDAIVKDFKLTSDDSNIKINARLNQVDLFNNFSTEKLQQTPAYIEIELSPFVFDDLSSFLPVTNLLDKKVELYLKADGPYGNLNVEQLNVKLNNTGLNIKGNVKNLHIPGNLFIDVNIFDSYINYDDVKSLLPGIGLPDYKEVKLNNLNIDFEGRPTEFTAKLNSDINKGYLEVTTKLNLDEDPIQYDVKLKTTDLDLKPVIGESTAINCTADIIGTGVSPEEMNSKIKFTLHNSSIANHKLNEFKFDGIANKKLIDLSVNGLFNQSDIAVAGKLDFTDNDEPKYDLEGKIQKLDLAQLLSSDDFKSNLNFHFDAKGENFDIDSLTGIFNVRIDSSLYRDKYIDNAKLALQIINNNNSRNIYLNSDFVDFTITGDFSLENAIDVLSYEAGTIAEITAGKLEQFNPLYVQDTTTVPPPIPEDVISKELDFNFSFTFKDFELIAILLDEEKLDIAGTGSGSVNNNRESFTIEMDLELEYLLTMGDEVYYISNLESDFKLTRDNLSTTFDDLFGAVSINCERIYAGTDIEQIEADLIFNQSRLFFNLKSLYDKQIAVSTDGTFFMSPGEQTITLDELSLNYNKVALKNLRPISMVLKPGESLDIEDFSLYSDPAAIFLYGIVYNDGRQNLNFNVKDLDGLQLSKLLFNTNEKVFDAMLNIDGNIAGTFEEPLMNIDINLDSVAYDNVHFGSLLGSIDYNNKNILIDAAFVDTSGNMQEPKLTINGNIPIDLNYRLEGDRFGEEELSVKIYSEEFNLSALGNVIPSIRNQKGLLTTEIDLSGTIAEPMASGKIELKNGEFTTLLNNLDYQFDALVTLDDKNFEIEKMVIKNSGGSAFTGTLTVTGSGELEFFVPKSAVIRMNGNLAILGQRSRSVQPLLYGDLFIESNGDWVFNYRESGSYFFGNVNLKQANLTFVAETANYQAGNTFDYVFIEDTTNIDRMRLVFEEIVESEKKENLETEESSFDLDYELNISTSDIVELEIILSQALNQKLSIEALGSLNYENIGGRSHAQGSFELLDGSQLEFFKTFDATGSLRFESDITDPYLDIVATYTSDYTPPNSNTTEEVAVKLKLQGPVSELGTNLANKPENISVYVGTRNIENNIPDERYDASDALSFILVNQFKADLTAQNRQDVANQTFGVNTATSLLGPILTGFVNSAVGDVVNNIQLSQSGEYTKFAVSGRFSNFRYSFGGTTELFQNINKANLRVDYLLNPNFLIRLERKDPLVRTFGIEDKITELGLKYRFEF